MFSLDEKDSSDNNTEIKENEKKKKLVKQTPQIFLRKVFPLQLGIKGSMVTV